MSGRDAFSVLMRGARRGGPDAAASARPPTANRAPASNGPSGKQLHLDLGQRDFSVATCRTCGMLYGKGLPEEDRLHDQFHNAHDAAFRFPGWAAERVVSREGLGSRLLLALPGDPRSQWRKVCELCGRLERVLGVPEGHLLAPDPPFKVFLWVSSDTSAAAGKGSRSRGGRGDGGRSGGSGGGGKGRVVGVLVAQLQERARWASLTPQPPAQRRAQQQRRQELQRGTAVAAAAAKGPAAGAPAQGSDVGATVPEKAAPHLAAAQGWSPQRRPPAALPQRSVSSADAQPAAAQGSPSDAGLVYPALDGPTAAAAAQQGLCEPDTQPSMEPDADAAQFREVGGMIAPDTLPRSAAGTRPARTERGEEEEHSVGPKRRRLQQTDGVLASSLGPGAYPASVDGSGQGPEARRISAGGDVGKCDGAAGAGVGGGGGRRSSSGGGDAAAATPGPPAGPPAGLPTAAGGLPSDASGPAPSPTYVRVVLGVRGLWVDPGFRQRGVARRMLDAARSCMVPGFLADRREAAFSACAAAATAGDDDGGAAFAAFAAAYLGSSVGGSSGGGLEGGGSEGGGVEVLLYDDESCESEAPGQRGG